MNKKNEYKYKCPTELGYVEFKLSRKEHNRVILNRKCNIFTKVEAFYKENTVKINYLPNLTAKIIIPFLVPYAILAHGLSSIKEIARDIKRELMPKKYGSFTSEHVNRYKYNKEISERFLKLEEIYKKQAN